MKSYLVDVDGVCADFCGRIRKILSLSDSFEFKSWDLHTSLGDQAGEVLQAMQGESFWLGLQPIDGAQETVETLRARGDKVTFITTPWYVCPGWFDMRLDWLAKNFDTRPTDVIFTAKKEMVYGDRLIDDKPEHVIDWSNRWDKIAVLVDHPYNRDVVHPVNRIENMREIIRNGY